MNHYFSKKFLNLMGFLALFLCAQVAFAQTDSTSDEAPTTAEPTTESAQEDTTEQEQDGEQSATEIAQVEDEEEESAGRFIPTEQLSQDLGASFPVDI